MSTPRCSNRLAKALIKLYVERVPGSLGLAQPLANLFLTQVYSHKALECFLVVFLCVLDLEKK